MDSDWSVTFLGPDVAIGQPEAGRVLVVEPGSTAESGEPRAEFSLPRSPAFGAQVAVHRRSGQLDLWVGAPAASRGGGAIHVYRDVGGITGDVSRDPDLSLVGETAADRLGEHLTVCEDLSGDGVPDLLIGAPYVSPTDTGPMAQAPELAGVGVPESSPKRWRGAPEPSRRGRSAARGGRRGGRGRGHRGGV